MKSLVLQFLLNLKNKTIGANVVLEFSKSLFKLFKDFLLKKALIKFLTYIPSFISGPVGWFGRIAISLLIDKTLRPLFERTVLKIYSYIKKKQFKKEGKKVEEATSEDEFDSAVDDLS